MSSKLPSYKRLYEQDFDPKYQDLIRQLGYTVNNGFEMIYNLLNGKLTIEDNMSSIVKDIEIEVDSNGIPKTKVFIPKTNTTIRSKGLWVIRAQNQTNTTTYANSGVLVDYTEKTDKIVIDHISGLPANNSFLLSIIVIN